MTLRVPSSSSAIHGRRVVLVDDRDERLAKNESFFRETNEFLEEEAVARGRIAADFICECSRTGCVDRLPITLAEYENVRRDGDRFIVVPGHEVLSIERVVQIEGGYVVVEKIGKAGEVARETDPR
jgi:hypothetical protein